MSILSRVFHQIVDFLGEIDAYQELFCVVTPLRAQRNHDHDAKREKKRNKYSERAAQFLAGVFVVIARLTMSNEIEIAMRSSRLRYRRKYIYKGSRLFFFWGLILMFWRRLILFHMRVPFFHFPSWEASATIIFSCFLPSLRPLYFSRRFILGRECDYCFFFYSPLPSPSIFSRHFILGRECDHCFIFYSKPPFALYIISAVLFWEESAPISFFSTLPSLPSLYFFRLFILGKECNHYFLLFSPLHSASLCFTSFVFCGVNFRHFLTTLLTDNDKEPVKKAKKFFSRPVFLSSSKLFALYTNRMEKMS